MAYPHGPALVLPRGEQQRWSAHQYGAGGELCLEWGPDNWHPTLTGAEMLASAFRLLDAEHPEGAVPAEVPSRHALTAGQELRGTYSRFLLTAALHAKLPEIPEGAVVNATLVGFYHKEAAGMAVASADLTDGKWTDSTIPADLGDEGFRRTIALVRVASDAPQPPAHNAEAFAGFFAARGIALPDTNYILVLRGAVVDGYFVHNGDNLAAKINVLGPEPPRKRLDDAHQALAARKAAIIGCGSLGSKIAVSLARSGVGSFLLVDDDVLMPGNLVRNDLDWREIGSHKVDAVARRIQMVNAGAACDRRKHRLGGQEASGGFDSLITSIARCDLILDATADPRVFNLLCAAVAHGKKPMVWGEVFGGGIGGLMARHRPGKEPEPATARAIIEQWCKDRGNPIERATIDYATRDLVNPLIADDADVTVMAGHIARFAIDTLLEREPSMFPVSAYMIGLAAGWEFTGPFETYPIELGAPVPEKEPAYENAEKATAELERILRYSRTRAMKLLLPQTIVRRLQRELRRAGRQEIGGLLMGEHVENETFRIAEISVQRAGGSAACFIRNPDEHAAFVASFFERTSHDYARFNYIGEWHSHPSFEVGPSGQDARTMQGIVSDPASGVNFLLLLVVKLLRRQAIELSCTAFRAGTRPVSVEVKAESSPDDTSTVGAFHAAARWMRRWLNP